jgi:hypothetical protein
MHPTQVLHSRKGMLSFGVASLLAMTATAQVATGTTADTGIDNSGSYRQEVQACMSGQTQEARDTCLREARSAHAAKQQGKLDSGGNDLAANALARCDPLAGEEKAACQARVMGYGQTSGSVAGGGVLRQVETVVMPPGHSEITIEPKTSAPVVLVPAQPQAAVPAEAPVAPSVPITPQR